MTCVAEPSKFRLLDHLVGWDAAIGGVEHLTGLDQPEGIQLVAICDDQVYINDQVLSRWIAPARIGRGCGPCEWYLVTPCPPRSRLLHIHACHMEWYEPAPGAIDVLQCATAVAIGADRIAVSDPKQHAIFLFAQPGERLIGRVEFNLPGPITHAPWGGWLVVDLQQDNIVWLDNAGVMIGLFASQVPGTVDRITVDRNCRVWIACKEADGRYSIWHVTREATEFVRGTLGELRDAMACSGITAVSTCGFCLRGEGENDDWNCYSWYGRPVDELSLPTNTAALYEKQGQLLTLAIDSGEPRCRWHRVRIDADVPSGCTLGVNVSSSEEALPVAQGVVDDGWSAFNAGIPHPGDWQTVAENLPDYLIDQPPGRYLFVRLRLTGDGFDTPRVRRIRFDFPRQTSLDMLPVVYRDNPRAEDFSERFLSLFDAFVEDVDSIITRFPALFDTDGVPDAVLPWLGGFLDVAMDPAWDSERRRRILRAVPELYRKRGTVDGMRLAVQLVFDIDPVIQEMSMLRPWSSLNQARLSGGVRLFGRTHWRFMLGRSPLSQVPIRSYGNPDRDPFSATAHRFRVLVPAGLDEITLTRLMHLVEAQKPAHTLSAVHRAGSGFVIGTGVYVGIDTIFTPLPAAAIGRDGNFRLGGGAVLQSGHKGRPARMQVGLGAAVGINSIME